MGKWTSQEGTVVPLGATWIPQERAFNFALRAPHAEQVTLLLYAREDLVNPVTQYTFDPVTNRTGRVWHCRISEAQLDGAEFYGYSISGPDPRSAQEWHAFDPKKVLLDPYAISVYFPKDFSRQAAVEPGSNAGRAPLGALLRDLTPFDWGDEKHPQHEADMIIYELHVRGFTRNPNSGVPELKRGTFAGLAEKIPYLQELGITAVELMPVFQYGPQEGNYWGYMTMNFFSLHQGYCSECYPADQLREFREMVRAFHAADIEVILDVVYNHTTEADELGPTYSFRGIDNSGYYMLRDDPLHPYENYSGTGNSLKISAPQVRRMIVDSLRYWRTEMHIDGFRYDLASVGVRAPDGSINPDPPIAGEIRATFDVAYARHIVEPWDVGMGGYLLGKAFPENAAWQWNGKFRDDVRRFVRGDDGMVGPLSARIYGSDDLFPDTGATVYHPYQSVNYVTAHDGFTLYDLVSYNVRRNWANGEENRDGPADCHSWNCGWEGDDNVPPEVLTLRKRQVKNFCTILMLSNGTPMLRAGDEGLGTQLGNNNPYNQDNETIWFDWDRLEQNRDIFRFFQLMIRFRKSHPSIARSRFWREDVQWHGTQRSFDFSHDCKYLAYYLRGKSQDDDDLYVMLNAHDSPRNFEIQHPGPWLRVVDTMLPGPDDIAEPGHESPVNETVYHVGPRSTVVLLKRKL